MLSRTRIKFIKSLQLKKYRKLEQCFVVEGAKGIAELLGSDYEVILIAGTQAFLQKLHPLPKDTEVEVVSESELAQLGSFDSNEAGLAVARMMDPGPVPTLQEEFILALDGVKDPGNLGSIIRTADWYGITKIVASSDTVDCYNGKVVQSTMGSFTRVRIWYTDLEQFLTASHQNIFGTFLEGDDVHEIDFGSDGIIVIGNESQGIGSHLKQFMTRRISIPRYGRAESLNAATATAIICDNLRRNYKKR